MATSKVSKYWMLLIILLIAATTVGGIEAWSRYRGSQPEEISISTSSNQEQPSEIYIGGAVNNPGFYPLRNGDSIEALTQAAGGSTTSADPDRVELYIPTAGEEEAPQKVDLNRAEAWLLEALPGIGESRAKAIIAYRQKNGPFQNINELIKVEGIGTTLYKQVEHLITVND